MNNRVNRQTITSLLADCVRCDVNQPGEMCCCKKSTCAECVTYIVDILIAGIGAVAIDLGFEYGYTAEDTERLSGWVKEAMISSSVTSIWLMLMSGLAWEWRERCKSRSVGEGNQNQCYATLTNIIIQLGSGTASFLTGMGVELLLECFVGHALLDSLKLNEKLISFAVPIASTCIKSLARYSMFKYVAPAIFARVKKCCSSSDENGETERFLNEDSYTEHDDNHTVVSFI